MIKVRINEGLPDLCIKAWYYHLEGEEYLVTQSDILSEYQLLFTDLYIQKSDCTIISDDTEQEDTFHTHSKLDCNIGEYSSSINNSNSIIGEYSSAGRYIAGTQLASDGNTCPNKEFVLPEKWCIKQNLDQRICDWFNDKYKITDKYWESNVESKGFKYLLAESAIGIQYPACLYSDEIPEGYTEITQDQFFAHVWEKELKKDELVLIAKAGEWVKPTYFDKCFIMTNNNGCGLVLNEPVLLHQDLYSESKKIYIESRYGIQHNESDLGTTTFELCEAPVPVVQETTDNYVSSVEEEHEEKINNTEVACAIAGFNLKRKDLDMFVSMYDLVCEYGGKLDLETITDTKFKVNSRHDSIV